LEKKKKKKKKKKKEIRNKKKDLPKRLSMIFPGVVMKSI